MEDGDESKGEKKDNRRRRTAIKGGSKLNGRVVLFMSPAAS
jgi:hypothetical protein